MHNQQEFVLGERSDRSPVALWIVAQRKQRGRHGGLQGGGGEARVSIGAEPSPPPPCRWSPLPRPGFPPQPAGSIAEKASDRKVELRHRTVRLPETAQGSARAVTDRFAPKRCATRQGARQR